MLFGVKMARLWQHPWWSSSLRDLWSHRWSTIMRNLWYVCHLCYIFVSVAVCRWLTTSTRWSCSTYNKPLKSGKRRRHLLMREAKEGHTVVSSMKCCVGRLNIQLQCIIYNVRTVCEKKETLMWRAGTAQCTLPWAATHVRCLPVLVMSVSLPMLLFSVCSFKKLVSLIYKSTLGHALAHAQV